MAKIRLKMADPNATEVLYVGDETEGEDRDWIRVKSSMTRAEVNQVLKTMPREDRDLEGQFAFIERFFDRVVVAWSLQDEFGNALDPTVENFRNMDSAGGHVIEQLLGRHLSKLVGREVNDLEEKSAE